MSNEERFLSQFGDELYDCSTKTNVPVSETLTNKTVLLYFSAHWCPPCRRFTPVLIELYRNKLSKINAEVVFCSLDHGKSEFDEYVSSMPWKAVKFENEEQRNKLAVAYKAESIPHLVIIDQGDDGRTIITDEGTSEVAMDPEGTNFPWKPKPFGELFPSQILTKKGKVESSTLANKHLMLYFSAHWCGPCRAFTPQLCKAYETMKQEIGEDKFELLFVSSDRDEGSFQEYYDSMNFAALPYEERAAKQQLSKMFGIRGIPSLLILGPSDSEGNRELINDNLRKVIQVGDFSEFPFPKKNYSNLTDGPDGINDFPSVVVFCESEDDEEQAEIIDEIKVVAKAHKDKRFFYSTQPSSLAGHIRKLTKIGDSMDSVTMILLDIPDNGGFYVSNEKSDVTKETIEAFLAKPGDRQQLGG